MTMTAYAELHCLSNFTFLRGASHPEELVARAHELGYAALALTDECSLAGVVRAHGAAKECGLPLIVGSEIRLHRRPAAGAARDRPRWLRQSVELITQGRRDATKGHYRLEACGYLDNGLPGCLALLLPDAMPSVEQARWLAEGFAGRAWMAVELLCGPDDCGRLAALRELGEACGLPLVAAGDVHMHVLAPQAAGHAHRHPSRSLVLTPALRSIPTPSAICATAPPGAPLSARTAG